MNHEGLYTIVGDRIRARRKELGMTQAQLAQKLDISRASLANIETGRQSILLHNLYSIAAAIELSPESLLPAPIIQRQKGVATSVALPNDLEPVQKRQIEQLIASVFQTAKGRERG